MLVLALKADRYKVAIIIFQTHQTTSSTQVSLIPISLLTHRHIATSLIKIQPQFPWLVCYTTLVGGGGDSSDLREES